jgi:hypothetical protein
MSVLGEGARVKAQVRSTPFVKLSRNKRNVPIIVAAQNKNQGTLYLIRYGVRPSVRRGSRQAVKASILPQLREQLKHRIDLSLLKHNKFVPDLFIAALVLEVT